MHAGSNSVEVRGVEVIVVEAVCDRVVFILLVVKLNTDGIGCLA